MSQKIKMPKEISQAILKKIFRNLIVAICVMAYFAILNLAYVSIRQERLMGDLKVFSGVFLVVGIVLLEKAYRKDKGEIVIYAIELLVMSTHTLTIMHVITRYQYNFCLYLLTSSYIFAAYFVLKAIILYTKARKEYLDSFSDISQIVKKEEPIKKEATKQNKKEKKETKNLEGKENKLSKPLTKNTKKKEKKQKQIKTTVTKQKIEAKSDAKKIKKENKSKDEIDKNKKVTKTKSKIS